VRIWTERFPGIPLALTQVPADSAFEVLREGGADAGFVRLPVDHEDLSAIPLYTETTVVVVPTDHLVTAVDEVSADDLADEIVLHPLDDVLDWEQRRLPGRPALERPATTADAIELVAAGVGLLLVPQSIARLHHRRDLTFRPLTDGPESRVALSWPQERTTDLVEDFIGVVRGRTANSSRGRSQPQKQDPKQEQPKGKRPDTGGARRKPAAGKAAGKNPRGGSGGSGGSKGTKRGKPRRRP
jgi:DNA-binding transcriptional LysR family regulator